MINKFTLELLSIYHKTFALIWYQFKQTILSTLIIIYSTIQFSANPCYFPIRYMLFERTWLLQLLTCSVDPVGIQPVPLFHLLFFLCFPPFVFESFSGYQVWHQRISNLSTGYILWDHIKYFYSQMQFVRGSDISLVFLRSYNALMLDHNLVIVTSQKKKNC